MYESARNYNPARAGVEPELRHLAPVEQVLMDVDEGIRKPIQLIQEELNELVAFVRDGLQDKRVTKRNLCALIPQSLPSGRAMLKFTDCTADEFRR